MKGVRDKPKEYGFESYRDWERWCEEELNIARNTANRFIKIVEELGDTYHRELGTNALYLIATLPPEERDVPHELPSGEKKKPEDMTVRELREVKRGQRAALVIRLHFDDVSQAAKLTQGTRTDLSPDLERSPVSGETAEVLAKKAGVSKTNMREIVGKAYTELGRELTEAQDELAKQGSKYEGVFERWYTYLGWKKRTVYNLIDRFNLVQNLHEVSEIERIEDLPVSLTYDIAAPSAESTPEKAQAKAEVLAGEIKTGKAYHERINTRTESSASDSVVLRGRTSEGEE